MENFEIEKDIFETRIYFNNKKGRKLICAVSFYNEDTEVYFKHESKLMEQSLLLEIDFNGQRESVLTSNTVSGDIDTLVFRNINQFQDFTIGRTPKIIRRFFDKSDKTLPEYYKEVFTFGKETTLENKRNIYFSIRYLKDRNKKLENGQVILKDYFLIGAYLYDPNSEGDEVYSPLQTIYAIRLENL